MSEEYNQREFKLNQLQLWHKENNVPLMVSLIKDTDPYIRAEALLLIGKLENQELYSHIIPALLDEDQHVRYCAIDALEHLGSPYSYEYLLKAATDNSDFVRCKAINALTRLNNYDVIEYYIKFLLDDSKPVRKETELALEQFLDTEECIKKLSYFFNEFPDKQNSHPELFKKLQIHKKIMKRFSQ